MKLNRDLLRKLPLTLRIAMEENAQRKPLTQSELAAEQARILRELRKHKAPGRRTDLNGATSEKDFSGVRATAIVGKLYGESHKQVEKRQAIVGAAEAQPAKYGKLKDAMDRTGRVNGVYRQLNIAQQAERIRAEPPPLPGRGPYRVAVIDPPWPEDIGRYDDPSHRLITPYPPMTLEAICAFPLTSILAPDAAVWVWFTNHHILRGIHLTVLNAWGLKPKAMLTWGKPHFGGGDTLRGQTEQVILAERGNPIVTLTSQSTLLLAPPRKVGKHSSKPKEFYDLVESLCPAPRYAYLFAGDFTRDNWDCQHDQPAEPNKD